jgi:hypothetical protein
MLTTVVTVSCLYWLDLRRGRTKPNKRDFLSPFKSVLVVRVAVSARRGKASLLEYAVRAVFLTVLPVSVPKPVPVMWFCLDLYVVSEVII